MKVSLKAVKNLSPNGQLPYASVDELVGKIGAQLGAVEEVIDYGSLYGGMYMVQVVECLKHPDADKLTICKIDDGGVAQNVERDESGRVQVVCGAPNVREGLFTAWLPPGCIVPSSYHKDPFTLEAREIRGVVSNGMLASSSELAINDDHSGLIEIDIKDISEPDAKPGIEIKKLFGLDDIILDIENKMFTHRPDCFGVMGVAREIFGIYGQNFETPEWYLKVPKIFLKDNDTEEQTRLRLEVTNEIPDLVPRFLAVAMDNIEIAPSPIWLQALLSRVGVKPINNVVDLTNYLSYLTAQPLHAYDYDKMANLTDQEGAVLLARFPREGEKVALLNGKTIEPRTDAIMIATDKELVGVGGVMGGTSTEVDNQTKRIVIECANFDMYSIRKTSMAHGLFTDAVTRFNKGQSPLQNDRVMVEMMRQVEQIAGGQLASQVIDDRHIPEEMYCRQTVSPGIKASTEFINSRLGLNLSKAEIMQLLKNVGFACLENDDNSEIEFHAPFWRTDISESVDLVEEIGRLYGFEKMPNELPMRRVSPALLEADLLKKKELREKLSSYGANEILNYSFVHGDILKKSGQDSSLAFKLSNALSPELQYYRLSLTPSLLTNIHPNIKNGYDEMALFEIGKVHGKTEIVDGIPKEFGRVALVVADKNKKSGAYYQARAYLDGLFNSPLSYKELSMDDYKEHLLFQQLISLFEPSRSAIVSKGDRLVGVIGEYKLSVINAFKLPNYTAGFEIFLSAYEKNSEDSYIPLSTFPEVRQDICYEIDSDMKFAEYKHQLEKSLDDSCPDEVSYDLSLIDIFQSDNTLDKKRITFHIKFVSYQRTLQAEFVHQILSDNDKLMKERINASRV